MRLETYSLYVTLNVISGLLYKIIKKQTEKFRFSQQQTPSRSLYIRVTVITTKTNISAVVSR